jgi:P-type Ca2+ transporter type 2C
MKYSGLSLKDAAIALSKYGYNELKEQEKNTWLKILLRQVKHNFMVYMLLFAGTLSFFVGKTFTSIAIFFILFIIVFVGFFQEYKADKSIKSLKKMISHISIVIRDGKEIEISSKEIVPGDIVVLRSGEMIPADGVLLEQTDLKIDESVLTGESLPIEKEIFVKGKQSEKNTLYMGTHLLNGKAIIKIIHTGMNTNFGKIAGLISSAEKPMPLQKKVNQVVRYMLAIAFFIIILTATVLISQNQPLDQAIIVEILIILIALAVSAFPEGLPVVLTTALATGAKRMAGKQAIVNRMSTIETLGEATIICSDKTGTITKGEMTAKKVFCDDKEIDIGGVGFEGKGNFTFNGKKIAPLEDKSLSLLLRTSVICNDSRINRTGEDMIYNVVGTPTEGALLVLASKANIFREDLDPDRIEEIPFSSESKMMGVLVKDFEKEMIYAKGAPEIIMQHCSHYYKKGKETKLSSKEIKKIMQKNIELNEKGYRTIALAYKKSKSLHNSLKEKELVFLGLIAIDDPPREGIKESINISRKAGIEVKMITGDNVNTAIAIGKQIGLVGKTINGDELDKITDDELTKIVNDITIFARVKPKHKLRIVKALKKIGEVVVMTGDGVNDAPSLKESHIGVAMGIKGTDVTRNASDLILKDDNFSSIVFAIKEGRTIFSNIRKFSTHMLACNFAELTIIFVGLLLGFPLPLLGIQILFMNIVTDDLTSITLSFNPHSKEVMEKKPRRNSRILNKEAKLFLAVSGLIMAGGTLLAFWLGLEIFKLPVSEARTFALVTLILLEIVDTFNYRSFKKRFIENKINSNKYLLYASLASIILTILIVYTPLNIFFETSPIPLFLWIIGGILSFSMLIGLDLLKTIILKKKLFLKDE